MTDANEFLIPALLSMDVYHRDLEGGLFSIVNDLPTSIDDVTPIGGDDGKRVNAGIGFFAKAYQ